MRRFLPKLLYVFREKVKSIGPFGRQDCGMLLISIQGGADVIIIGIKFTMNVMHVKPPTNPWSLEKLPFMKLVPGYKKVGDRC